MPDRAGIDYYYSCVVRCVRRRPVDWAARFAAGASLTAGDRLPVRTCRMYRPLAGPRVVAARMLKPAHRRFWFTAFIVAGIVLAVVLLGQTVWTYVFVSRDLVRREARRQAGHDVSALERAIVTGQIRDPEPLSRLMSDLQRDASARLAWVNLIGMNGTTLAGSAADQQPLFTAADIKGTLFARDEPSRVVQKRSRDPGLSLSRLVGDVSGTDVSAALLMAVVHGAFHGGELRATGGDLSRWMRRLNTLLIQRSAEKRFVTLFCGTFDARTATVTYVNGGHLPPLLYRAGDSSAEPEPLETGGPAVGPL